jgi:cysteine-rich repeat protein
MIRSALADDANGGVVVSIWYSSAEKLVVNVLEGGNSRYVEDMNYYDGKHKKDLLRWGKIDSWAGEEFPTPTSPHGSNAFDRTARTIRVALSGTESVEIVSIPVVQVSLSLSVTVAEFYQVEDDFVQNICFVLQIPPSRMTIVNVVPGNARRRLAALHTSDEKPQRSDRRVWFGKRGRQLGGTSGVDVEFEIEANPVVELAMTSASLVENTTMQLVVKREVNPGLNGSVLVRVSAIGAYRPCVSHLTDLSHWRLMARYSPCDFQVSLTDVARNIILLATDDTANGTELATGLLFRIMFPAHTNEVILSLDALNDADVEQPGAEGIRVQIVAGEGVDVGRNSTLDISILSVNIPRPLPPQHLRSDPTFFEVEWDMSEGWWSAPAGAEVLSWEVQVRPTDPIASWTSSTRSTDIDTMPSDPTHAAQDLLPAHSYHVRVRGRNAFGVSEWSEESAPILTAAQCGDGWRELDEGCDDGNTDDGDGCTSTCAVEVSRLLIEVVLWIQGE